MDFNFKTNFIVLIFLPFTSFAQQGENFGYKISNEKMKELGELYVELDDDKKVKIETNNFPYCTILNRNKDSLRLNFWNVTPNKVLSATDANIYDEKYNGKTCVLVMKQWEKVNGFDFFKFKKFEREANILKFRHFDITALNLPFRISFDLKSKETKLESEFLNINLAGVYCKGETTLFKNSNIKNKVITYGLGPFVGVRAISDSTKPDNRFGLNYGVTSLYSRNNLQFNCSFGAETDFIKNGNRFLPFLAFGVGFELFSLFEHEIEKE
jgi:hypothetical protein